MTEDGENPGVPTSGTHPRVDPGLVDRFMAEDKLPNLAKLGAAGDFRRLRTTFPALSPVAWSTFATGVNPARHNIFDFLNDAPSVENGGFSSVTGLPGAARSDDRENLFGAFVQDDWKVKPNLTLHAGMRYSY